jgi:hypothetical protein
MEAKKEVICINRNEKIIGTILELTEQMPDILIIKRCLLKSPKAKKTYFTPWFYNKRKKVWVGVEQCDYTFYIKESKDIKKYQFIKTMPLLPKTHPYRIKIDDLENNYKYSIENEYKKNRREYAIVKRKR